MLQPMTSLAAVLTGVLMATFQLVRPWGDVTREPVAMAEAFADPRWTIAHLAGAASFVAFSWFAMLVTSAANAHAAVTARIARLATMLGAALVLPYFGAEMFGLNELGSAALAGSPLDIVALADGIRNNTAAISLFGLGLLLVAVGGICVSLVVTGEGVVAWATWPLGVLMALALPQFALPPVGRMLYGVLVLFAGVVFAIGARRLSARTDDPA